MTNFLTNCYQKGKTGPLGEWKATDHLQNNGNRSVMFIVYISHPTFLLFDEW